MYGHLSSEVTIVRLISHVSCQETYGSLPLTVYHVSSYSREAINNRQG
jgi:hypothetical protein